MDPWEAVRPDREALAGYLDGLSAAEWATQSWCSEWSVKGVACHLLVASTMTKGQIFVAFLKAGFNLDKMSATLVTSMSRDMTDEQVAAAMRNSAGSRSAPPGLKPIGVLSEVLIHASDISRAVGRPLELPVAHYVMALEHMKGVQPVLGAKKRIAGLTLRATDADWSTGDGPLMEGPAELLLAAMTGRRAALSSLTGPGVDLLASR
jgi:uncharacterized protein (TIGR03083 family)